MRSGGASSETCTTARNRVSPHWRSSWRCSTSCWNRTPTRESCSRRLRTTSPTRSRSYGSSRADIHPAVLTDHGLAVALDALAERTAAASTAGRRARGASTGADRGRWLLRHRRVSRERREVRSRLAGERRGVALERRGRDRGCGRRRRRREPRPRLGPAWAGGSGRGARRDDRGVEPGRPRHTRAGADPLLGQRHRGGTDVGVNARPARDSVVATR